MKKIITIIFSLALFSGCAIGPVHGFLFTTTKFAGEINPSNDVTVQKTGESCQHQILTLVAFGDASAGNAAQSSGIKKIATVDHSTLSVLTILYRQYCTIVAGE